MDGTEKYTDSGYLGSERQILHLFYHMWILASHLDLCVYFGVSVEGRKLEKAVKVGVRVEKKGGRE